MKIIRFEWKRGTTYGIADGHTVFEIDGSLCGDFSIGQRLCDIGDVRLLSPVRPRTVIGVGANYHGLVQELGMEIPREPSVFLKAASCVVGHLDNIVYPKTSKDVRFEAELAVIMKCEARHVPEDRALEHVLGYTCANDLTAHDFQDRFPTRNKSFYTSCPLGPCIATDIDGDSLRIRSRLNGILTHTGSTQDMIFSVSKIISYITEFMPLEPLDVILTGTPEKGVQVEIGDTVEIEIERVGVLRNTVG